MERSIHDKLSLGDEQHIKYAVTNDNAFPLDYELTDELPMQLQHRGYIHRTAILKEETNNIKYRIRPTVRGLYSFGDLHAFISFPYLGFLQRRVTHAGIRRVRQVGENDEFEHIRNYTQGDNIRSINWRATSRRGELMVNQYENSKSQMVYTIIDKGRSMKMPFNELTLLDYAINSSLVLSNIILKKYDRAGLITFSDKIGAIIKASSHQNQLQKITSYLYNQVTGFKESNFELLFYTLRKTISRRSVMIFFTNFEHKSDLKRNLRYLKILNKKHLLVVVMFKNTELEALRDQPTRKIKDIYYKTFAEKSIIEKEKIANELKANGIQVILTAPEDLSVNVVNKYLEIKAKRMK